MLRLNFLQDQYLILSFGCGIGLMIAMVLVFLMLKKERPAEFYSENRKSSSKESISSLPWVIILTWVSMFVFGLVYVIKNALYPPNW
jgi:Na+/H+ antiporter NhaD/arsenite permease-like protein